MAYEHLLIEDRGPIRVVTINRPTKLNALNRALLEELDDVFRAIEVAKEVRAVILTGAGEKAFVAGADIRELNELNAQSAKIQVRFGQSVFSRIECLQKPVVAAINGWALGGGCELALACHLRVAAPEAKLGLPEVKLGIIPGYGGTQRLQRVVGGARALELILTGEPITATEARAWGLVNKIAEDAASTVATAEAFLGPILKRAPLALGAAMEASRRGGEVQIDEAMRIEADLFGLLAATHDMHEGMQAFLEKRRPRFEGR
ncbi:MAG: enoyl-CoA hydratase/isomerase family protein [Planctomycetota bacterium]|jgi:enoyl-CoA hydratase